MKKSILSFALMMLVTCAAKAQKGANQLKIIAEAGISPGRKNIGFGGYLKGLYGVCGSGQLTLTAGVAKFREQNVPEHTETITRLIPFLAGYKQNIKKFYAEPQIGYGELGGRIESGGDYARPSVGAFFWAIGAGYGSRRFDTGIRYQSAHGAEGVSAGIWHHKKFHFLAIHAAFNLLRSE